MPGKLNGDRRLPEIPTSRPKVQVPMAVVVFEVLATLLGRGLLFLARHYIATTIAVGLLVVRVRYGTLGLTVLLLAVLVVGVSWRLAHPRSFAVLGRWWWGRARLTFVYRPRWRRAMVETKLAIRTPKSWGEKVAYNEHFPRIRTIRTSGGVDRLRIELLYGQTPEQWAERAEALRHVFRAQRVTVTEDRTGFIWLRVFFRDPLAATVRLAPLAVPPDTNDDNPDGADEQSGEVDPLTLAAELDRLTIGRREDGRPWLLALRGNHVLVAGSTGSGKGSVIWSTIRALAPAVRAGLVELWVADPKGGMELASGADLFTRFAIDAEQIADLLDDAVTKLRDRAGSMRGRSRLHVPTVGDPLIVVVVDEIASLTAYVTDRELKRRIGAALPLLLSQGRAPGVVVLGAVQDPRKETLPFRDLFTVRICLRTAETDTADLVLGDGAHDRGAHTDRIPEGQPGTGYVRLDGQAEPVRVRAGWVDDDEIRALADVYAPPLTGDLLDPAEFGGWLPDLDKHDDDGWTGQTGQAA